MLGVRHFVERLNHAQELLSVMKSLAHISIDRSRRKASVADTTIQDHPGGVI